MVSMCRHWHSSVQNWKACQPDIRIVDVQAHTCLIVELTETMEVQFVIALVIGLACIYASGMGQRFIYVSVQQLFPPSLLQALQSSLVYLYFLKLQYTFFLILVSLTLILSWLCMQEKTKQSPRFFISFFTLTEVDKSPLYLRPCTERITHVYGITMLQIFMLYLLVLKKKFVKTVGQRNFFNAEITDTYTWQHPF